jgi:hypothetical protein
MILEEGKVPWVLISEIDLLLMEQSVIYLWDGQPSPPVTPVPANGAAFNQPLGQFPQEANLMLLPAATGNKLSDNVSSPELPEAQAGPGPIAYS